MTIYRSIDGSDNNTTDTDLNGTSTAFGRLGPAHFADGISTPEGGPNPRTISNLVVGIGDPDVANPEGLSAMMYAWGQFIDHDLTLTRSDGVNAINITVPSGDPVFADGSFIPMTRAVTAPATGTDASNPATAANTTTGWLDASMVYGFNATVAASLRTADGHLIESAGGNLPIENGMFVAGDPRAAENPALTSLHTLFLREHNYQVDRLQALNPTWTGDQLYDEARAIVAAEIANITYSEFLVNLLGDDAIAPYTGYDSGVDPRITLEFAGAAFRFGHSIVSGETENLDEFGNVVGPEHDLKDVFFQPAADFIANSGADGQIRHLGADPSQALDSRIIDDLRNFLSDPPATMDLAAINIQRSRDLGIGKLNETRIALGLDPYTDFSQITSDLETRAGLQAAYGNVNNVGLWTGGLSEDHVPGAMVGETFRTIIAMQFEALRDGDRLWFENQGFDAETLDAIRHTSLADIILRNTDTHFIQQDMFVFYTRHTGTLGGVPSEDPDARQLVIGRFENDELTGGAQNDYLFGGLGHQTLTGLGGDDRLLGGRGADTMAGGEGNDRYVVDDAGDVVQEDAGEGRDIILTRVDYALAAGSEVELLRGYRDTDGLILTGNEFGNRIVGGDGDDTITGGLGRDVLVGGDGDDTFVFGSTADSNPAMRDLIVDFMVGSDRIDLSAIDAIPGGGDSAFHFIGNAAFGAAGDLRVYTAGTNTVVAGEVNGDGRADFMVVLRGLVGLQETDFLL